MNSGPQTVKSLLHTADAELGIVVRQARYLARVRGTILAMLPDNAANHVHVATVDPQRLLLHVDSAGWATRLRYAEPSIRRALAQHMRLHVENVVTRVRPALAQAERPRITRQISAANRDHMRRVASYIDNPVLAQTLLRLASHDSSTTDVESQAATTGRALT